MSSLSEKFRPKRFNVQDGRKLSLLVSCEWLTSPLKINVENVSLYGIGGKIDTSVLSVDDIVKLKDRLIVDEIYPSSKLVWSEADISKVTSIGRIVIKNVMPTENSQTKVGVSLIDKRVPIDSKLGNILSSAEFGGGMSFELSADKFDLSTFARDSDSNMDVLEKCQKFSEYFKYWRRKESFLYETSRLKSKGPRVKLRRKRKRGKQDYIIMGSNDYLGFASHPKVEEAVKKTLTEFGFGSTGSPVTTGQTELHDELEERLSAIFKKEKTILFNSGYAANLGTLQAICTQGTLAVGDYLMHSSLRDGMKISDATARYFRHNDTQHLDKILNENKENTSGSLVITEGVFSMDGNLADMKGICEVASKHGARTYLDEAHSFGIVGEKTEWLRAYARSFLFSVSLPPSTVAGMLASVKLFEQEPQHVQNIKENVRYFVEGMIDLGFPGLSLDHPSAVVPAIIGNGTSNGKNRLFSGTARKCCMIYIVIYYRYS